MVFADESAGGLTPTKDKAGKTNKKILHRHCGVRLPYGIANAGGNGKSHGVKFLLSLQ